MTPAISPADTAARRAALQHWYGVTRLDADILVSLYLAKGEPLTAECLAVMCSATRPSVHNRISALRSAMEAESIDYNQQGYRLTDVGQSEVWEAMQAMARSLVA